MSASTTATAAAGTTDPTRAFRIPATGTWQNMWKVMATLGALGIAGSAAGYTVAPERFAFSWLFGFFVALTLFLGAVFFVVIQFLTVAGWSVTVRRTAEFVLTGFLVLPLLFLPVAFSAKTLYPWMTHGHEEHGAAAGGEHGDEHGGEHGEAGRIGEDHMPLPDGADWDGNEAALHAQHSEILHAKAWYLNLPFWWGRVAFYFLVWGFLAWRLFTLSTSQDKSRDLAVTKKLQAFAPGAAALFALSLTFAGFDWIMGLEPTWYSTIFGVYIFAGCAVAIHALVIVLTLGLRSQGHLGNTVNTEHYHDLGKMTFGFTVFWAYIGFSQFMLIWYASIPEETTFFHLRWESAGWRGLSMVLVAGHFVAPFLLLLSRNAKRRLPILGFGAGWLLLMHVLDIYWLVLPYGMGGGFSPHWLDFAALFACVGSFMAVVFFFMSRHSLVAVGDPRIGRAMRFHNA